MDYKQQNRETAEKMLCSKFWLPEYDGLFSEDFSILYPSAPPGMPQYMDAFDASLFKKWLCRTVKTWDVSVEELHGTPDPDMLWAVGVVKAGVHWGGREGSFESKLIMRITFKNAKIHHLKIMLNPLKFLEAAGIPYPVFKMDLFHPEVDKFLSTKPEAESETAPAELDMSKAAISARIENNLNAYRSGDYFIAVRENATYSPDLKTFVWFLPPEMTNNYPPELMPRVHAWTELSCISLEFDKSGRIYPTDDPLIYFAEFSCTGETNWLGNNCMGHYRNNYFYILRFDDAGRILVLEEFLNPVNKYNSINVSIPSFPYYL